MHLVPGPCSRCKSNPHLPYHTYCKACKREYMQAHPQKYKAHPRPPKTLESTLWPKIEQTSNCWWWLGAQSSRGYPNFRDMLNRIVNPACMLWKMEHGEVPEGFVLVATCGNRLCVNPSHYAPKSRFGLHKTPVEPRFWANVNKNGPVPAHKPHLGPCWIWEGRLSPLGYGQFYYDGRDRMAHVVAWRLERGEIEYKEVVRHLCDIRSCVRLDHLALGSQARNIQDMIDSGRARYPHGEQAGKAKLVESQVRYILAEYLPPDRGYTYFARMFNVTPNAIRAIIMGWSWRHLRKTSC